MQKVQTYSQQRPPTAIRPVEINPERTGMPVNMAAEYGFIGGIIEFPSLAQRFRHVRPEWFYHNNFELYWRAALEYVESGRDPEIWTMSEMLERLYGEEAKDGIIDDCLRAEIQLNRSMQTCDTWAKDIRIAWQQREALRFAAEIAGMAHAGDFTGLTRATVELASMLRSEPEGVSSQSIAAGMAAMLTGVEEMMADPKNIILTGMHNLDSWTGGFRPGQLVTLTGQSGMGKSAAVLSIVLSIVNNFCMSALEADANGCHELPESIEYFTFDMSTDIQCMRAAAQLLFDEEGIATINDFMLGFRFNANGERDIAGDPDFDMFHHAADKVMHLADRLGPHLYFHQMPTDVAGIVAIIRDAKRTRRPRMFVIDQTENVKSEESNRVNRYTDMVTQLKQAAVEEAQTCLMLHQMSREVIKERNRIPQQEHLRDSGQVGNASDMIIAGYNPSYYWPEAAASSEPFGVTSNQWYREGMWLIGLKHRMNSRSSDRRKSWMYMRFVGERTMISEAPSDWDWDEFMAETERRNGEAAARGEE